LTDKGIYAFLKYRFFEDYSMPDTLRLKLPLLAAGQSQKHVTVNDALVAVDELAQIAVINRTQTAPPPSFNDGDSYLVAGSATGAFAGHEGHIAVADSGGWRFHVPRNGWCCYVVAEQILLAFVGTQWVTAAMPTMPPMIGINASADAYNRFTLKSNASLFDHVGSGHQLKLNKAASTDTASLLYQTAYSGRAEMGLMGDDAWRCKVSHDGASWKEALVIDAQTGLATVFGAPTATLGVATKGYVDGMVTGYGAPFDYQTAANQSITAFNVWTQITNLSAARIASANFSTAQNRFTAPATGTYLFVAQLAHTAGAGAVTVSASILKNGTASGLLVSRAVAANGQDQLLLVTFLPMIAGDTAALGIYATAATTVSLGTTSLSGHRV
jgi:hypothetical protein